MDEEFDIKTIWNNVKQSIKADSLIRNFPYFLLLATLGIIYIANAHYHLKLERKIDQRERELKKLSWEYLTIKSDVMYQSKQSEVAKKVEILGLQPLQEPPKVIELNR